MIIKQQIKTNKQRTVHCIHRTDRNSFHRCSDSVNSIIYSLYSTHKTILAWPFAKLMQYNVNLMHVFMVDFNTLIEWMRMETTYYTLKMKVQNALKIYHICSLTQSIGRCIRLVFLMGWPRTRIDIYPSMVNHSHKKKFTFNRNCRCIKND